MGSSGSAQEGHLFQGRCKVLTCRASCCSPKEITCTTFGSHAMALCSFVSMEQLFETNVDPSILRTREPVQPSYESKAKTPLTLAHTSIGYVHGYVYSG